MVGCKLVVVCWSLVVACWSLLVVRPAAASHLAAVDERHLPTLHDKDVARVGVAMDEARAEDHPSKRIRQLPARSTEKRGWVKRTRQMPQGDETRI